jgi:hypothetical protein
MAQNRRPAGKEAGKSVRSVSQEIEARVVRCLGNSGILKTSALAEQVGHNEGAVRRACWRLHESQVLRLSRTPQRLFLFALTGDVIHRGNYPVAAALIALGRAASKEGGLHRNLHGVFAALRADPKLRSAESQNYISRCEAAARRIRSDDELLARLAMQPFLNWVIHWWPRVLEDEYEEPVRRFAKKLDKRSVQSVLVDLKRVADETRNQLERRAPVHAKEAQEAVHKSLTLWDRVAGYVEDSGAQDLLAARRAQLTALTSLETIPEHDLLVVPKEELQKDVEAVHRRAAEDGEGAQKAAPSTREESKEPIQPAEAEAAGGGKGGGDRKWAQRLASSLQLVQATLVVANDILPLLAGTPPTIPSAAGTPIGSYLGGASSILAGVEMARVAIPKILHPER